MIEDLKTDYKSDILMPIQQNKRTFNIIDSNNNILYENVHIEDSSQYLQVGDEYGSDIINEQNAAINILARGTGLTFNTYQDYLDARALGEVPVGSIIYILEGNQTVITANQVTYNSSNVKLALDTVVSNLGSKSSASAVTGDDAFSKINTLNTSLSNKQDKLTNPLVQSDVVDNLTSTATNKPLSAAQGKALNTNKANIGALAEKTSGTHTFTFKWTNDSYIEIWVDSSKVAQIKGFKRYD